MTSQYGSTKHPMSSLASTLPIGCSRLILCEKSGHWANTLRRVLTDSGRWIVETRSLGQLAQSLAEHPASLCLVEVTAQNLFEMAECIARLHHQRPLCHLIAASRSALTAPVANLLQESGAAYTIDSRRDIDVVQRLWQAHSRRYPPREVTGRDQICASLPLS